MKNQQDKKKWVEELTNLIEKAQAHITFEDAVKGLQPENYGRKIDGIPYTIWQLVEHLRIAQADILDFSQNPDYNELQWPEDYWPQESAPKNQTAWENSLESILEDRQSFIALLHKADDIFAPFPHGMGQNLAREAMLIADHNAYHIGQIIVLRRILKDYKS